MSTAQTEHPGHEVPPHLMRPVDQIYRPPTGPEFSHLSWLEPLKLPDVWFSGDSATLTVMIL
ncbi:hypothetical protein VP01_3151g1 [Puccinia sorghi]|uniref:Uncharacterized protein n=1 Tax=Puccinia sorghi TaxID=27349 RepID=A0A0L6UZQ1_9BASI|nr:hypothetical protein VP01_3151g1 [Puccinia sorghi]